MILADKIINERKKNGWSQEELAEKLGVSRQAVSKWEGAQTIPDIQKILKMAEVFGVSTDYLLKDDIEKSEDAPDSGNLSYVNKEREVYNLTLEEANEYLNMKEKQSGRIAVGVMLCIMSPVILIILAGLTELHSVGISEGMAAGVGTTFLLIMVALAVYIFITSGMKMKHFEFLETEVFETAYGVDGMTRERQRTFERRHTIGIAAGVVLCILAVIPVIVAGTLEASDVILDSMVCILLILVGLGVEKIVNVSIIWGSYSIILQEGEYTAREKKKSRNIPIVSGIYWCVVTAVYLGWSFAADGWDRTWVIWPVAGVMFAAVAAIAKAFTKVEE